MEESSTAHEGRRGGSVNAWRKSRREFRRTLLLSIYKTQLNIHKAQPTTLMAPLALSHQPPTPASPYTTTPPPLHHHHRNAEPVHPDRTGARLRSECVMQRCSTHHMGRLSWRAIASVGRQASCGAVDRRSGTDGSGTDGSERE